MVKNFFLIHSLILQSFSLKPLSLVLSQQALIKSLSSSYKLCPHSLLFSRLKSPSSLSLSSQERCSIPQIVLVSSSGPAPTGPGLSCAEGSRAICRTPSGVSPEWSRGIESPPSTCWPRCWTSSPGDSWLSGLRAHIGGSCPAFHPPAPTSPSLDPFIPQPVLIARVAPTQVQDLALGLAEPQEVHKGPVLKFVQVPLDRNPSLRCVDHTTQPAIYS